MVEGHWVSSPESRRVTGMLAGAGHEVYFVGGCVRNALMDLPVADIDLATDARPEAVVALAEAAGLKAVPTGIDHGTVTVVSGHAPYEITTYRQDVATDGRRATVAFAGDIATDAARRDFTMNALYADPQGRVIDPIGGLDDLRARRVRFIGDAHQRIIEDGLRMLRFFRFHAHYGHGAPDAVALAAIAADVERIRPVSHERIGAETAKLLSADDPSGAVGAMDATGLLVRILPGADPALLAPLVAAERGAATGPRWQRRLAALGGADWTEALRLSKSDRRALAAIRRAVAGDPADPAILAYRHGADAARDAMLIRAAAGIAPVPDDLEARIARGAAARFPLAAADLLPRHGEGPDLGRALKRLEARWLDSGMTLDRAALLAIDSAGDA